MIHVTLKVELLIKLMLESISSNNYFIWNHKCEWHELRNKWVARIRKEWKVGFLFLQIKEFIYHFLN